MKDPLLQPFVEQAETAAVPDQTLSSADFVDRSARHPRDRGSYCRFWHSRNANSLDICRRGLGLLPDMGIY